MPSVREVDFYRPVHQTKHAPISTHKLKYEQEIFAPTERNFLPSVRELNFHHPTYQSKHIHIAQITAHNVKFEQK